MDPVTQGALGGAVAIVGSPREARRVAAALGFLAGMAADLDILIRSAADPLLVLEFHRQFTHALVFIPIGGFLSAVVAHPFVRRLLRFRATLLFCVLGYASHGLLDACTSYGTQLLWPFSDARFAWNYVSVVDPLFTVPLLVLLGIALWSDRPWVARAALCWCLAYLAVGAIQHQRARSAALELAEHRGHLPERLVAKPSFGNVLVWKAVYEFDRRFHVDAIRVASRVGYYPGESIPVLDAAADLPWLAAESRQHRDLGRFRVFSQDFVALDTQRPHRIIDVRYAMLPNRIDALWGVQLDPRDTDSPAEFVTDRISSPSERRQLIKMILGPGLRLSEIDPSAGQDDRPSRQNR